VHERQLLSRASWVADTLALAGYQLFVVDGDRQVIAKPDTTIDTAGIDATPRAIVVSTHGTSKKGIVGIFTHAQEDRLYFSSSAGDWELPFSTIEWIEDDHGKRRPEYWLADQPRSTLSSAFVQYHDIENTILMLPNNTDTLPLTPETVEPKGPIMVKWVGAILTVIGITAAIAIAGFIALDNSSFKIP
jgi:hypothetical protein